MKWQEKYADKVKTPEEAAKLVKSGDKIVASMMTNPVSTLLAIANRRHELKNVTVLSHWFSDLPWYQPGWEDSFQIQSAFILRPVRDGHRDRRFDLAPAVFGLNDGIRNKDYLRGKIYADADVAIVKVTPPDEEGWCSFGHDIWYSPVAARTAGTVIAEIDPNFIWTYGDRINVSDLDCLVDGAKAFDPGGIAVGILPAPADEGEKVQVIGANIAELVRDGDNIEVGTGTASEGALEFLGDKNELGIDSEMVHLEMIDLIKAGNITGKRNNMHPGKYLATCLFTRPGDRRVRSALEFVNRNPIFEFHDVSFICNVPRIAAIDNMVSINNGLTIDLQGQIVLSHLGPAAISGPGGQLEYNIGAHYSKGGRSVVAIISTAKNGTVSRIVPQLPLGSVVLIPNVYVDYLVTEYGIANLDCKSDRERAEAIISVAAPAFQPELKKAARKLFWP